jgi:hypothetical protein
MAIAVLMGLGMLSGTEKCFGKKMAGLLRSVSLSMFYNIVGTKSKSGECRLTEGYTVCKNEQDGQERPKAQGEMSHISEY